jgi:hypothetical protein
LATRFEQSYKQPGEKIDVEGLPSVDDLKCHRTP